MLRDHRLAGIEATLYLSLNPLNWYWRPCWERGCWYINVHAGPVSVLVMW